MDANDTGYLRAALKEVVDHLKEHGSIKGAQLVPDNMRPDDLRKEDEDVFTWIAHLEGVLDRTK